MLLWGMWRGREGFGVGSGWERDTTAFSVVCLWFVLGRYTFLFEGGGRWWRGAGVCLPLFPPSRRASTIFIELRTSVVWGGGEVELS